MSRRVPPRQSTQVDLATDALNGRDFEALATVLHPELEHHSAFGAVEGEVYRGIDGQRKRWRTSQELGRTRIEVAQVHDVDDVRMVVI